MFAIARLKRNSNETNKLHGHTYVYIYITLVFILSNFIVHLIKYPFVLVKISKLFVNEQHNLNYMKTTMQ